MWEKGVDIHENHVDCGEIVYKVIEDEFQGGSGAGCSATVLNSYLFDKMRKREISKILFAATGALLSTVSSGQGKVFRASAMPSVWNSYKSRARARKT